MPSVTRYFDHVQSESVVRQITSSLGNAFQTITLDIDNAPKYERKVEIPKKKEKAPKAAPESSKTAPAAIKSDTSTTEHTASEPTEKSQQKKEKKKVAATEGGSKEKKAGGKAAAKPVDDGEPTPSMIDLRVGHIVDSKLYI